MDSSFNAYTRDREIGTEGLANDLLNITDDTTLLRRKDIGKARLMQGRQF